MVMSLSQEMNPVSILASQFIRKEKTYRHWIEHNDAIGSGLASRLTRDDQFENLLGEEFTNKCREKLKVIVKDNVTKERKLKAYMNAVKSLKDNYSPSQEDNKDDDKKEDFQQKLENAYSKELENIENNSILVTQEPRYLNLLEKLGEQDDQDDELAVVNPKSSDKNIKCPLALVAMKDPVRSKICKHSFSRVAIVNHLRLDKKCPVPGCSNNQMTIAELEDDPDTATLVRRYKKREELQKRAKDRSAIDMDDDDDE